MFLNERVLGNEKFFCPDDSPALLSRQSEPVKTFI